MLRNKVIPTIIISTLLLFSSCTKDNKVVKNPPPQNNQTVPNEPENKAPEPRKPLDSSVEEEASKLSNADKGWFFNPNKTHTTPYLSSDILTMLKKYSGYYVGDTNSKVIYLTFDEGYENGYTSKILDVLKANDVPAAFFVTRPYINDNKDLINRMVNEGHIVANHTSNHPSMPSKATNLEAFQKEFEETEKAFKNATGKEMPRFFRPPMGKYSERSLYLTKELGYKTIFWSFAHKDWLVNEQPSVKSTHDKAMERAHSGAIYLLHAVSKSNTEAMDSILKDLKAEGYRFASLTELD